MRNLEIIGEAAKKIPEEIRMKYSVAEWKEIKKYAEEKGIKLYFSYQFKNVS